MAKISELKLAKNMNEYKENVEVSDNILDAITELTEVLSKTNALLAELVVKKKKVVVNGGYSIG